MAEYNFGSVLNRDFILELKRMAEDVNVQGKTIQDLVAEGQLTEEQYAELISVVNGMLKSGEVDKFDLSSALRDEVDKVYEVDSRLTSKLATKASKEEARLKAEKLDLEDMSPNALAAIEGGEGTTFDLLSIPQDKSVSPEKTTFIKLSNNLLNPQEITFNTTVDADGNVIPSNAKWLSDFIPVLKNDELSITERATGESSHGLFYYDENKAYLTQSNTSTNGFTVPNYTPIQYVRISSESNPNKVMMNRGSTLLNYEPYSPKIKSEMLPSADGDIVNIEYNDEGRLVAISEENSYGEFKTTNLNYDGDTLSAIVEEDFSRGATVQSNLIYDDDGKLISIQNT